MARIPLPSSKECKSALDAGAGGIIVPMIETAKQLEQIRDACCWPPNGNRGVGFSRANLFGKNFEQYKEEAKTPLLIAQIENKVAIKNLDKIVKINGLDAIIIGPYDLSASMGITAEFDNEKFKAVMSSIKKICQKNNIAFGDHIVKPDSELLLNRIKNGYTFIAYGTDGVFLNTSSKNPLH
jgi:2-dehydro-3-deoxyglucarate aldolase